MKKMIGLFIFIAFILVSCLSPESLRIDNEDYLGNELKIDGFYYKYAVDNKNIGGMVFFYNNGVVYHVHGGFDLDPDLNLKDNLDNHNNLILEQSKKWKENRAHWGLFNIDGDELNFNLWGHYPHRRVSYSCEILNDTTFNLNTIENNTINQKYYFHKMEIKPDSINNYVP